MVRENNTRFRNFEKKKIHKIDTFTPRLLEIEGLRSPRPEGKHKEHAETADPTCGRHFGIDLEHRPKKRNSWE